MPTITNKILKKLVGVLNKGLYDNLFEINLNTQRIPKGCKEIWKMFNRSLIL